MWQRLFQKAIIICLLLAGSFTVNAQVKWYEDRFNGGVTGAGWSRYDWSGNKTITVNIAPCSKVRKAYLLVGRIADRTESDCFNPACPPPDLNDPPYFPGKMLLDGDTLRIDSTNTIGPLFDSRVYGYNSAVHILDVTNQIDSSKNSYVVNLIEGSNFEHFYLFIAYEKKCLPVVNTALFINDHHMTSAFSYENIRFNQPVSGKADLAYVLMGGYLCGSQGNDWETIIVNNDTLGKVGGADGGSANDCSGVMGDFYYESNKLNGLGNDNPDLGMNNSDGISNLTSIIKPGADSLKLSFYQGCQPGYAQDTRSCYWVPSPGDTTRAGHDLDNFIWAVIFAYGDGTKSPVDTLNAGNDLTICPGESAQITVSGGSSYSWNPEPSLSCINCANPVATPTVTTRYVVKTGDDCCLFVDTITVFVGNTIAAISPAQTLCPGNDSISLHVSGGTVYSWNPPLGLSHTTIANPKAHPPQTTTYTVTVGTGNCTAKDSVKVMVSAFNAFLDLGTDTSFCRDTVTPFMLETNVSNATYLWSTAATTAQIEVINSGTYWLQLSDLSSGCKISDTIKVVMHPVPDAGLEDILACGKDTLLQALGGSSYLWNTGATTSSIKANASTAYWVEVTNSFGCKSTDSALVTLQLPPVLSLNDTVACALPLMVNAGTHPGAVYSWSTGETTPAITVTQPGKLIVTITSGLCTVKDSMQLTAEQLSVDLGNDTLLCSGETLLLNANAIAPVYLWSNGSTVASIMVDTSGSYWLEVATSHCIVRDTIRVAIDRDFSLGNDTTLCGGTALRLDMENSTGNYLWSTGETTGTVQVGTGTYWLIKTNDHCTVSDTISVQIVPAATDILQMPNIFTPNEDQKNDLFKPLKIDFIGNFNLSVYNRWGRLMYKGEGATTMWDGYFEGNPVPEGVYFWIAQYSSVCNSAELQQTHGTVTLTRNEQ